MKIIKTILWSFLAFLCIAILSLLAIWLIDLNNTSYLKIKHNPESQTNSYLITQANVIPMTADTVLKNTRIKVINGKIEAVGPDLESNGLPILDAGGAYLSPGLTDMHVHVWDEFELGLYLANGVTTVRNLWGQPMHLRMKKRTNREDILSPLFFTAGPKLTGPDYVTDDNLQLKTVEQAREKIHSYKRRGYDLIKTYYGLTPPLFDAVIDQAQKEGLDIAAHPSAEVSYDYHFKSAIKSIEHVEDVVQIALNYQLDSSGLKEVARLYGSHPETSFCPTAVVYYNIYEQLTRDNLLQSDSMAFMNPLIRQVDSPAQFNRWQQAKAENPETVSHVKTQHNFQLRAIYEIHKQGGHIVCGTDAGIGITKPGYAIHRELAFYSQAGLSNYEVLKTATINPSRTHDFLALTGSIEKGKWANFILTPENPLENLQTLKKPQMVMVKGRKIPARTLQGFEEKAQNRRNLIATAIRYAEFMLVEK